MCHLVQLVHLNTGYTSKHIMNSDVSMEWCFHSNKTMIPISGVWLCIQLCYFVEIRCRLLTWAPSCAVLLTTWPGDRRVGLQARWRGDISQYGFPYRFWGFLLGTGVVLSSLRWILMGHWCPNGFPTNLHKPQTQPLSESKQIAPPGLKQR